MDISNLLETLQGRLGETLPSLLGAIAILLVGWFVALVLRAGLRRALGAVGLNERVQSATGNALDVERGASQVSYYGVLVVTLIAFFNALKLELVSGSLQTLVDQFFVYAPRLLAGGVLLLVGWVIAALARSVATQALAATSLDEKLSRQADMAPVSQSLGHVLYWLILLLFLPAVLGALEMEGLLDPVRSMVDQILAMLPSVLGAGIIGAIGWFVARILRDLVTNLLSATGVDGWGARAGLSGNTTLSGLAGLVVYVFVFVPALIAALDTLAIESISGPAREMLAAFMDAIPRVFGAGVILGVAYVVSRFVADLTTNLLGGVGFDALPERLGLAPVVPDSVRPSEGVGRLVIFFVMLFAVVEAAGRLGFDQVAELVSVLIEFGAQVLLGLVIIAVGFWISNQARDAVVRVGGDGAPAMAGVARFAILGIVVAMGLRAMGLADDIVNLAFGLTLGAVAVAVALSFGLGGREAAGRQMEHWLSQLRRD
ncbi:MAG: mechanosensitive ion channel [Myxococcota bacterium]